MGILTAKEKGRCKANPISDNLPNHFCEQQQEAANKKQLNAHGVTNGICMLTSTKIRDNHSSVTENKIQG